MLKRHPILAAALSFASLLVLLGSPGPWLSGLVANTRGMEGDGQVTLALGGLSLLIAAVGMKWRAAWLDAAAVVLLATAGGIGLYDWVSGDSMLVTVPGRPEAGWGLALVTIGGLSAMAAGTLSGAVAGARRFGALARFDS